jgi:hypothetical protein
VEAEKPEACWLEQWARAAQAQGTRALDRLREGVEQAIKALGRGFLAHPANAALRDNLRSGELDKQDYYRQLLRLVYRLLFLFVAEDRDLLYDPAASPEARERYIRYYATRRLRHLAERHRGTKHIDLYRGLRIVMEKLGSDDGCPPLALPALGGFLWSERAICDLAQCEISNRDFLEAIRALAFTLDNKTLRAVDYKNLGSEELGNRFGTQVLRHCNHMESRSHVETCSLGVNDVELSLGLSVLCLASTCHDCLLDQVIGVGGGRAVQSPS